MHFPVEPVGLEKNSMKLIIALHAIAAGALITASVMTFRLVGPLPVWFGVLVGVLLYAMTLWIAKGEAASE